jgi:release factor H-coupled RctB family protein
MPMVRITIRAEHDHTKNPVVVVPSDAPWSQLVRAVHNKLRFKAKHLYVLDTSETLSEATCATALSEDCVVIASKTADSTKSTPKSARNQISVVGDDAVGSAAAAAAGAGAVSRPPTVDILIESAWLEDSAVKQLTQTASDVPGVRYAIGMPDLHPGKRYPIGAVFATEDAIFPCLVGGDIGCGMSLVKLPTQADKVSEKVLDRWAATLANAGLDDAASGIDVDAVLSNPVAWARGQTISPVDPAVFTRAGMELGAFNGSAGTVGSGNHFAEFQRVDKVFDVAAFEALALDSDAVYLLVHSGSRGLGAAILSRHLDLHGERALRCGSPEAQEYLDLHDSACQWARHNRRLITLRILAELGLDAAPAECLLDIWHNSVSSVEVDETVEREKTETGEGAIPNKKSVLWLHRKGAAPSTNGLVVIPGSRGALSYLVMPLEPRMESGFSLAHGAGRKWHRSKASACVKSRYPNADDLRITKLHSRVVCSDKALLYEEAPEAYKDISGVVADLVDGDYVKIVATLCPLLSYKTSR